MTGPGGMPGSVDAVLQLLAAESYVADRSLATAIHLSLTLGRPLLLEGEARIPRYRGVRVLHSGPVG